MRLYSGTSSQFIHDNIQNQIAEKLKISFFEHFRYNPSPSEVASWCNSLRALSQVIQYADLLDHGVLLEYQLPMTSKRLDCMITGRDVKKTDQAIIIELKQWDKCRESNGENEVQTMIGGGYRDVLHPSVQVGQYQMYLEDTHTAFYEDESPVALNSCAYLHNYGYDPSDVIFSGKFAGPIQKYPLFTADDVDKLKGFLQHKLSEGSGIEVLNRVEESRFRPSKKLMEHVGSVIKGKPEYILLDEQKVVYDMVFAEAKGGFHDRRKTVILIKGGPGTGKSVIAVNLMADLLLKGYNAHYATGSKAFTETLRNIIGRRGSVQFKYFNSYTGAQPNEVDILICDEAHRIRENSNNFYTPKAKRSDLAQIEELLRAAKVGVFFIDDNQVVRPNEVGSTAYIKDFARKNQCNVLEYELEAQFRCSGSDAFINWVNNTLGISKTANVLWSREEKAFDFRIFDTPEALEEAITGKWKQGHTARLTAGFCWPWSDPDHEGNLVNDVVAGDFQRPWNAKPEAAGLVPGIPKSSLWAYEPGGIHQVGCIYTAQGFEFDYVGVIFGKDLVYDPDRSTWMGCKEHSWDGTVKKSKDRFTELVKNTYRVLLTRGMKGCYVYFMDKDTERFFRSRME